MKTSFKAIALAALLSLLPSLACAQSTPNLIFGQVPTAGQWNSYFAAKQDVLGYVPLNIAGGVMTGQLILAPSTLSLSSLNMPVGVPPTTPQNGDMWATSAGLFMRVNGVTVGPFISALLTTPQVINLNSAPLQAAQSGAILQMGQANSAIARAELDSFANTGVFTCVRADGTAAAPTAIQSGDEICSLNGWGYNGSAFVGGAARLSIFAAQTWSVGSQGARIVLSTTSNGTNTLSDRFSIENDGGILVPPTVTGGDKGVGTINATGLYIAGNLALASPFFSFASSNVLSAGINGSQTGAIDFMSSAGGAVRIQQNLATAGYNFNLPTSAGTAGQPLLSGGGVSNAQTYGTLGPAAGGTGLTSGTSGGILGFTGTTTVASSVLLTANALVLGGGAGATPTPLGSLGTTTTVLHGNAAGAPTFAAVSLTADVSGNLPVTNLASGTNASANSYWRGDGSWQAVNLASASVTNVLGIANGGTNSGSYTAGSIPFANSTALAQDNANLFWDNTNKLLAVGTNSFSPLNGEHMVISGNVATHFAYRIVNNNASGFSTFWLGPNNEGFIRFGASVGNKMTLVASVAGVPVTIATAGTDRVTVTDTGVAVTGWFQMGKTTVAGLPTCNAGQEATLMFVTDQNTAVSYRGAVTGGGTTHQLVLCSNSAWIQD